MKSNFRRNLLFGFGASLLVLMISSVASFTSIRMLLSNQKWVNHTNNVLIELELIKSSLVDAETGQRGFLLTGNESFLAPFEDAKARALSAITNTRELTMDNPAQQLNLKDMIGIVESRVNFLQESIDLKMKKGVLDTSRLVQGKETMDKLRTLIELMKDRELQLLEERTTSLNKFSTYTPLLILAAAAIAIIITILFYARTSADFNEKTRLQAELEEKDKEISRRIGIIRGIADTIAQGNYEIRVDDKQSDSLGSVAGSLNRMAGALQTSFGQLSDNEWMQTGLSQLRDVLIGDKSLELILAQTMDFQATYTQSQAGALYLVDGDDIHFKAGYSYLPEASRENFRVGDGIVGQVARSGDIKELRDMPKESILLNFTLGQAKPQHVVAVPLFDGHVLKGVLEVASLRNFPDRTIEFLRRSSQAIGIAITTAQSKRRLQELLEETQAQAEELKAQHSELENINNELEVQSEKLQASEEELKVQQEELKQANQELEERSRMLEDRNHVITQRNDDIQAKSEQLVQSAKYKSEFLANMSHELRTPLNSILLLSRLMSENHEKNLSSDQIEYARVIQNSGNGLLSLIDEILDLSKLEAGKMQMDFVTVNLKEIVRDVNSLFGPVVDEKKIELRTSIAGDVPDIIKTDKMRLEQVLRNFLSNAVKFTSKGFVDLSILRDKEDPDFILIKVKDTGIGIPGDKQDLVFEAFQQADGSTRRKYGGTGLGLSISRELAKLLGGTIKLKSEVEVGSEFTLRIPLSSDQIAKKPDPGMSKTAEVPAGPPIVERKFISTTIPESLPDDRKIIQEGDRVILIIEDDVSFARSLMDYAKRKGYKVLVAVRGDEGVELAVEFKPVGVLLDIQLPVKSGWEVMEALKGNVETRHIPVHMMSFFEARNESMQKGAVNFINKPVQYEKMQEIFNKIEYVLTHNPKKVLIVEENAKHAKALAYFLETFDVKLDIKTEVKDAISSLTDEGTDCVILDMGIPGENAYATLEAVKKTPGLENLPIIIFTGKSLSQTEEQRIKQYADSIVVKTAHSYKRILDEVTLFLHLMEKDKKGGNGAASVHKLGALDEVLKGKTVLIADDDMRNIFSLTKALEQFKMKVITAVDGKDALEKLKANREVDIVLMDMMMPEMDGYESTAAIRKDPAFRQLPIIAVTAKAMIGDRAKCINAGASDYITKPVDIDQLLSLLRVWLYDKSLK